ncbi:TPM domain-containing protein [Bacillus tuaregi]|uniref:TPM domain-containing protein n=1 Tax=Bacillus tuaregi TaxID=1816695 RepID=UPI0008F84D65|nr:TPM domain-containing protein [Bacillus tuaregi]
MVKNIRSCFLFLMLLFLLNSTGANVQAAYEKVFDEADLFTEEQREELNNQALALSEQTDLDIIVVTISDNQGKTSSQYALDFYQEHGFGYQGTLDGVLYLLNMAEREVYIFTRDRGTDYIPADRIEELLDLVYPSLGEENYSESVHIFLNEVGKMMEAGYPGEDDVSPSGESGYSYTDNEVTTNESSTVKELGIYLLISFAIGGIAVTMMAMGNRGRSTVNARTYLENDSFILTRKSDRHYNTIVTQQKIQRNNNSGGSSFTGGSGGGGIGGGGRKF